MRGGRASRCPFLMLDILVRNVDGSRTVWRQFREDGNDLEQGC